MAEIMAIMEAHKRELGVEGIEFEKRDYQIVTDVLAAINQTQLAPQILKFLATDSRLQPIVINGIIAVIKSGLINLPALFDALDESNLVGNVIEDLISDCSLYVELFNAAKGVISNLANIVKDKIASGISSLTSKREVAPYHYDMLNEKRDLNDVVVNLLDSLYQSGLASSVVKSVLTDSSYIPFAVNLIKAVLANNALNLGSLVDALKESGLAVDLLKQILTVNTFQTVVTNAFAAFAGTCAGSSAPSTGGSSSSGSGSSGSGSGSSSGGTTVSSPCKRKVRRRRRRRAVNY